MWCCSRVSFTVLQACHDFSVQGTRTASSSAMRHAACVLNILERFLKRFETPSRTFRVWRRLLSPGDPHRLLLRDEPRRLLPRALRSGPLPRGALRFTSPSAHPLFCQALWAPVLPIFQSDDPSPNSPISFTQFIVLGGATECAKRRIKRCCCIKTCTQYAKIHVHTTGSVWHTVLLP